MLSLLASPTIRNSTCERSERDLIKERLLFVIRHMPPIVYENDLGPAACAELQIEVALSLNLALTSRNLGKMVVTI